MRLTSILAALILGSTPGTCVTALGQPPFPHGDILLPVSGTGSTFTCSLKPLAEAPYGCQGYSFSFPSALQSGRHPLNNTVSGELYRPLQPLKTRTAPAVVVYHIIGPGLFVIEQAQCRNLARHGVTALFFHLPFYGPRSGGKGPEAMLQSPQLFTDCLNQAIADSRRAVDLLLQFPDVDPAKIGATGVSLGSLMTANAVATDSRITKAMMILGGGNLRQIISGNVYETYAIRQFLNALPAIQRQQMLQRMDRYDPLACAPALKRLKAFVMLNADQDHIIPPDTSRQLAAKTGTDIHWYPNLNHYTAMSQLEDMLKRQVRLFAQDVPKNWNRKLPPQPLDMRLAAQTAQLFLDFTGANMPEPGRAHVIQGVLAVNLLKTITIPIQIRFALGPQNQFRAATAAFTAGQDATTLWLTDNRKIYAMPHSLLKATIFNNSLIDGQQLKMLQAALAFLAQAPDCLRQCVAFNARTAKDGFQILALSSLMPQLRATVYVTFNAQGQPKKLSVNAMDSSLTLTIHHLIRNKKVPDTFFSAPTTLAPQPLANHKPFHTVISKLLPFILPPQPPTKP